MSTRARKSGYPYVLLWMCLAALAFSPAAWAIKDPTNQARWNKPGGDAPDKQVPGFLVNLGPTGARAVLTERTFVVHYVFPGSPAFGKLKDGDVIGGVFGKPFSKHTFGGEPHGYEGPIMNMGSAIEQAESKDGKLVLNVSRDGKTIQVEIPLEAIGAFSPTFPFNCKKSELLRARALKYLTENPDAHGGASHTRMAVILALLSSDNPAQQSLGRSLAIKWSGQRADTGTWTWDLSHQTIALCEYYILTHDGSVLPTIKHTVDLIQKAEYTGHIVCWRPKKGEDPGKIDAAQQLYDGGFGHAPYTPGLSKEDGSFGPNGYGPMQYTTILAVTARQLAARCGVPIDADKLKRSMDFIHRGTNEAGYVAYGGEFTLNNGLVDPVRWKASHGGDDYVGRVGCAIIAHELGLEFTDSSQYLVMYRGYVKSAYKSMPDGHADSNLGLFWCMMGAAASEDPAALRTVLDYHKAWFNMMRCYDASYVLLPGRNYADDGYYGASRYQPTATMALMYGLAYPKLRIQGVEVGIPGVNPKALKGRMDAAYKAIVKKDCKAAFRCLYKPLAEDEQVAKAMSAYIDAQWQKEVAGLEPIEKSGDILSLDKEYLRLVGQFKGITGFDKAIKRYEDGLDKDPWRKEIVTGKNYLSFLEVLKKYKSASAVKKMEEFAQANAGSVYGKWAAAVVKEFKADGTVSVSAAGRPFGEPAP